MIDVDKQIVYWRDSSREDWEIEGRYPELLASPPNPEAAKTDLGRAREVYEWLMQQL